MASLVNDCDISVFFKCGCWIGLGDVSTRVRDRVPGAIHVPVPVRCMYPDAGEMHVAGHRVMIYPVAGETYVPPPGTMHVSGARRDAPGYAMSPLQGWALAHRVMLWGHRVNDHKCKDMHQPFLRNGHRYLCYFYYANFMAIFSRLLRNLLKLF